jgi:hypothetical protein
MTLPLLTSTVKHNWNSLLAIKNKKFYVHFGKVPVIKKAALQLIGKCLTLIFLQLSNILG